MKLELNGAYLAGANLKSQIAANVDGLYTMHELDAGAIAQCVSNCEGDYIEIGTLYGGSAILAAYFCRGMVYCVDPFGWGPAQTRIELIPSKEQVLQNVAKFGFLKKVTVFEQRHPPLPNDIKGNDFDVAFIDGDHTYEGAIADWNNLKDRVNRYVLFHDVHNQNPTHGAWIAFDEACNDPEWELVYREAKMGVVERID